MEHILRCHDIIKTDFVKAENCYLYDTANQRFVDFEAGVWCAALGHNHPRVQATIQKLLGQVIHLGVRYPNQVAEDASISLLDIAGFSEGKCVFLSSGSEAVEFGVQIAKRITGRKSFLVLSDSYLSAYGSSGRKEEHEWMTLNIRDYFTCDKHEGEQLIQKTLNDIDFDEIAAFVFEPGCFSGTIKLPPKYLINTIVEHIKKHQGLIVIDEVTTGMGRTGKWFGFQHYGFQPDIVACGKGLGNGYPISAVAMKPEIAQQLEDDKFYYAQSHQNDPLGCAIAKEVITVMEEEGLIKRSHRLGQEFLASLQELKDTFGFIKDVRGRGLMLSIEFDSTYPQSDVRSLYRHLLQRRFIVGFNPAYNVMRFFPPLTTPQKEFSNFVEQLRDVLETINRN